MSSPARNFTPVISGKFEVSLLKPIGVRRTRNSSIKLACEDNCERQQRHA